MMANFNSVILIGRLTRAPEPIPSKIGGAKFGFAVNNRKFDQGTQKWEDVPVFLDCEIWNRGENKQAERVLETLAKGQQIFIEGHLKYDSWDDRNGGGKRSKITVVVDSFQYLEARQSGGTSADQVARQAPAEVKAPARGPARRPALPQDDEYDEPPPRNGAAQQQDDIIPF
jgi:single-strand DNA-binding protein